MSDEFLEMECLACNQKNCLEMFKREEDILRCIKCDAIQTARPTEKSGRYEDDDIPSGFAHFLKKFKEISAAKLIASSYIKYLKTKTNFNFKTALDVGAKYGVFVKMLHKYGIDAYGIEAYKNYINLAVTDKLEWGYFNEEYKTDKKFDLICLTHMMYYVRDNYSLLNHARNLLNDDGIIFISTYNPTSSILKLRPSIINSVGANMVLSKKNYQSLENKFNLTLLDYTTYRSDFLIDIFSTKHKMLTAAKYFCGLKEPYPLDNDGNHAFLMLKKI